MPLKLSTCRLVSPANNQFPRLVSLWFDKSNPVKETSPEKTLIQIAARFGFKLKFNVCNQLSPANVQSTMFVILLLFK
ncbi:MAG: hypothetical protein WCJ81_06885 [bacterium]